MLNQIIPRLDKLLQLTQSGFPEAHAHNHRSQNSEVV